MPMAMGHRQADFLLFNLGWDARWGTDAHFGDYWVTNELAHPKMAAEGGGARDADEISEEPLGHHKNSRPSAFVASHYQVVINYLVALGDGLLPVGAAHLRLVLRRLLLLEVFLGLRLFLRLIAMVITGHVSHLSYRGRQRIRTLNLLQG